MTRLTAIFAAIFALSSAAIGQSATLPSDCSAYASVPLPPEAENTPVPTSSPSCASYKSYRGLSRPVNFAEARACAWQERLAQKAELRQNPNELTSWIVGGSLILADIYFNGAGVQRNVPLAMRFACESEEGMAKLALEDIEKRSGTDRTDQPFEFCTYAATTITMNFCFSYIAEIDDDRRDRFYESLQNSMSAEQRTAFQKLRAAKDEYIKVHRKEVYQGGTIRGMRTISSQNILKDLFQTEIVHFERKKWPALTGQQIGTADALLNGEYEKKVQQLGTHTKDELEEGAVSTDQLIEVQKAWETYRDAWDSFARVRYPDAASKIRAQITLDRYRLLKTID